MTKSAGRRVPTMMSATAMTSGFGHHQSAMPIAAASTAMSCAIASVARHALRRVSSRTISLGRACRWSSLNSSPKLFVDAAQQDVLHFEILLEAVLRALAAEAGLLHAAEGRDLGR